MSRTVLPFVAGDVSALARALRRELEVFDRPPGHVQLLNMLARAAGYRNFQHFRAEAQAQAPVQAAPAPASAATPAPPPEEQVDLARVERVARCFQADGQLARWPSRRSQQRLCHWIVWSWLPSGAVMSERQVNELLNARHLFGDHALLRRELIDAGLLARTRDGREYRRVERRPPPEALALMQRLGPRAAA